MGSHGEEVIAVTPEAVGAGYVLRNAATFPKALTKIAVDEGGHAALLVGDDHDLRVFHVDAWRTQILLDPEHRTFAREVVQQYLLPRGFVTLAFTRDARHIVVVDAANVVTLLDRAGNIAWRSEAEPPDPSPDWRCHGSEATDEGALVRVEARWWRHLYTEPDGNPVDEARSTTTRFEKQGGRVSRAEGPPASAVTPVARLVRGYASTVTVGDETLQLDPRFGAPRSIAVSSDARRILVGTEERYLLLLERG